MSDWMLERPSTGPGTLVSMNVCVCDPAPLTLELSVHPSFIES